MIINKKAKMIVMVNNEKDENDETQLCQFSELTPLSCIVCMTICCSVHKSALTYKEIIFSTLSNQ